MFNGKNHVGRPSNEELKLIRTKKILMIGLPVLLIGAIVFFVLNGSLSKLMGNSVTEYYCENPEYKLEGTNCVKDLKMAPALLGDTDTDGIVTVDDYNLLLEYLDKEDEKLLSDIQKLASDIDKDGEISYRDSSILNDFLNSVVSTYSVYYDRVSSDKVCLKDYNLDESGNLCIKKDIKLALIKKQEEDNQNNDKANIDEKKLDNENIKNNSEDSKNQLLIENNTQSTSQVSVDIVPEKRGTNFNAKEVVNLNVKFKIYDQSKQYYYIWSTYTYDKNTYNSNCQKVQDGEYLKSLTINGTINGIITVYSDSSCKTKLNSVNTKTYRCKNCTNQVKVDIVPEKSEISFNAKEVVNLNAKFEIQDKSKKYYYMWSTYTYDKNTYNSNCQNVQDGEYLKSLTINGTRRGIITVYSDPSCIIKLNSVNTKTYTCKNCTDMVNVTFKPQDNNTSLKKGTVYKLNAVFEIKDTTKNYYYTWVNNSEIPTDGISSVQSSFCSLVRPAEYKNSFTVSGNTISSIVIYSDSSCKNKIKKIDSKKYTCSNCVPLTVSIGKTSYSSVSKGTVINVGIIISHNDKQDKQTYYYKWDTYTNNKHTYESDCQKVVSGKNMVKTLTINGTRKGTITTYTDNECRKRISTVPIATTTTYTCNNCNVSNNNSSNNSNNNNYNNNSNNNNYNNNSNNNNYNYNTNNNNTNQKNCTTKTSKKCPNGYSKNTSGSGKACRKFATYSYTCPSGSTKVGDGPTAHCQKKKEGTCYVSGYCVIYKDSKRTKKLVEHNYKDKKTCLKKCYVWDDSIKIKKTATYFYRDMQTVTQRVCK